MGGNQKSPTSGFFGSTANVWIPDAKRTKLDFKSHKLMLIGYSDNHKAYWLIDVAIDCLTFSRDVVFDEEGGPFLLPSPIRSLDDQPLKINDLGTKLLVAPLEGRDSDASHIIESSRPDPLLAGRV